MWAPTWTWVLAANVLLGVSQGLTWSTTVIMKIDLVGPRQRGLAMGLNEFAGYSALPASAFATGWIAAHYGIRPQLFYLGVGFVVVGLVHGLNDVAASTGSACHSGVVELSPVLKAMRVPPQIGMGAVRFSLGRTTTEQEIETVVQSLRMVLG